MVCDPFMAGDPFRKGTLIRTVPPVVPRRTVRGELLSRSALCAVMLGLGSALPAPASLAADLPQERERQMGVVKKKTPPDSIRPDSAAAVVEAPNRGLVSRFLDDPDARVYVVSPDDRLLRIYDPQTREELGVIASPNGQSPERVAVLAGGVWLTDFEGWVDRIDPEADQVVGTTRSMTRASHIVGNDGTVWIDNGSLGFVSRIDPATGAVIDSVEIGWAIHDIALAGDELWVLSSGRAGGQLHIVSGSAIVYHQEFPGIEPTSLVIDGNTVWAHESFEGRVYRLDARARTATAVIDFGVFRYEDGGLVTGAGSVWVALASLGAIARIDAATNELIGIVELGSYVADVAYGGGWVWAVLPDSDLLVRIHPDSGEVTARIRVLGKPTDVEVG